MLLTKTQPMVNSGKSTDQLFVLSICTRDRLNMLDQCINSVNKLAVPIGWTLEVVIIDNEPDSSAKDLVNKHIKSSSFNIFYRHEPDTGIPQARNNALDFALEREADYLGFIDDDEFISENWLIGIVEAFSRYRCDVVQAPVRFSYNFDVPSWLCQTQKKTRTSGTVLRTAATDNVAFHRRLIAPKPEGFGLRFCTDMRFTGGSDTDFFFRATDAGAKIIWTSASIATEQVPKSRATVLWQIKRAYRTEANSAVIYLRRKGIILALLKYVPKVFMRIFQGVLSIFIAAALYFFNRSKASTFVLLAGKRTMSAFGAIAGLLSLLPSPYKKIDAE